MRERPSHLENAFVKHTDGREALVVAGPMQDAKGERWICRIRYTKVGMVETGQEEWGFADDLNVFEKKPQEKAK
jgi:hypothetical protein